MRAYGADEALTRLRAGIRAYNEAVGTANSDTSGYHETLTVFYVREIARCLVDAGAGAGEAELEAAVLATCGARDLPLRYYSRERLFSVAARRGYLEPDLSA